MNYVDYISLLISMIALAISVATYLADSLWIKSELKKISGKKLTEPITTYLNSDVKIEAVFVQTYFFTVTITHLVGPDADQPEWFTTIPYKSANSVMMQDGISLVSVEKKKSSSSFPSGSRETMSSMGFFDTCAQTTTQVWTKRSRLTPRSMVVTRCQSPAATD